jgi:hypothetical protein
MKKDFAKAAAIRCRFHQVAKTPMVRECVLCNIVRFGWRGVVYGSTEKGLLKIRA